MSNVRVSLVATLLNEYGSLPAWIRGLKAQTRYPDECIIVDGGSVDGTAEYLRSADFPFPTRILSAAGSTISEGRNIGIRTATGDVIAVTDAGTRADERWLEYLVAPLDDCPAVDIVAGAFAPASRNEWTVALAAATLPDVVEIDGSNYLPSSRSIAIRRRWFDGGFEYPEWLDYCEDLIFDLQMLRAGARMVTEHRAVVRFFPRETPRSFVLQYFRYARGDGRAGLFAGRHLVRYLAYVVAVSVLVRRRPVEMAVVLFAALTHVRKPILRLRRRRQILTEEPGNAAVRIGLVVVQMVLGDVAKMAGYPVGLLVRARQDGSVRFWRTGWTSRAPGGHLPRAGLRTRETPLQ